jgi:hypothetical protein
VGNFLEWLSIPAPCQYIAIGAALRGRLEPIEVMIANGGVFLIGKLSLVQAAMVSGSLHIIDYLLHPGRIWPPTAEMISGLGRRLGGNMAMYPEVEPLVPSVEKVVEVLDWWLNRGFPVHIGTVTRVRNLEVADNRRFILIGGDVHDGRW